MGDEITTEYNGVVIKWSEYYDRWEADGYDHSQSLETIKKSIDKALASERKFDPPLKMWKKQWSEGWQVVEVTSITETGDEAWTRRKGGKREKSFVQNLYIWNTSNNDKVTDVMAISSRIKELGAEIREIEATMERWEP